MSVCHGHAGIAAIEAGQTHYGPSPGLPSLRATIAETVRAEFGIQVGPENVIVASANRAHARRS